MRFRPPSARDDRRSLRPEPIEALEGRALLALAFSSLPFQAPASFVTGGDGNLWYVPATNAHQIGEITTAGRVTQVNIPEAPDYAIGRLAAGPDGNVWFTEATQSSSAPFASTGKIGRVTPGGMFSEYAIPSGSGGLSNELAGDIEPGPDGDVWFTEAPVKAITSWIARITPAGQVTAFTAPGAAPTTRIVGGADGNLYYTEPGVGQIGKIGPSGSVTQIALPGEQPAAGLASGPDGDVYFLENGGVGRITPAGVVTFFDDPNVASPGYSNESITAGPDGDVYFLEAGGVGRITPAGVVTDNPEPPNSPGPTEIGIGPQRALLTTAGYVPGAQPLLGVILTAPTAAPATVSATPETLTQGESLAAEVAHFSGTDPLATAADYQALIAYSADSKLGDETGIIRPDPAGGYDVYLSANYGPTFAAAGRYAATVTIFDTRRAGASVAAAVGTVAVLAGSSTLSTVDVTSTSFPLGVVTVGGEIGDAGTLPASTYTATIDFGDGSPAVAATVTALHYMDFYQGVAYPETNFTVTANHQYAHPVGYVATVTFRNASGPVLVNDLLVFANS